MPRDAADVSVIVPAYRAAETIGRALASVAAQTVPPREVIVVDDGSDDGTAEAAEAACGEMNGISLTVLRLPHSGAGAARNRAVAAATGRWLAFLDADDAWRPEKLARCTAAIEESGATLVVHDMAVHAAGAAPTVTDCARSLARNRDPYLACYLWSFVATSTALVAREAMTAAGGFDPGLPSGQDFETWLAVLDRPNASVRVLSEPLADYYVRPGSISSRIWLRRACALRIALDHADALARHTDAPRRFLLLRTLIIHYQAATAYAARHAYLSALGALAIFPVSALKMAFAAPTPRKRPDFLTLSTAREHEPA